jgi:hypothetical protein
MPWLVLLLPLLLLIMLKLDSISSSSCHAACCWHGLNRSPKLSRGRGRHAYLILDTIFKQSRTVVWLHDERYNGHSYGTSVGDTSHVSLGFMRTFLIFNLLRRCRRPFKIIRSPSHGCRQVIFVTVQAVRESCYCISQNVCCSVCCRDSLI